MIKEEIAFLRNMLLNRRTDLLERVQKIAATCRELGDCQAELEEEAQKEAIAKPYETLDKTRKTEIEQIDLALTKMAVGEYGICESCGDDIDNRRLRAIPWARLCIDCARDYESKKILLPSIPETIGQAAVPDEFDGLPADQILETIYDRLLADGLDLSGMNLSICKGVLFLNGVIKSQREREAVIQILTDTLEFAAVVDRLELDETDLEDFEENFGVEYPFSPGDFDQDSLQTAGM